MDKQPIKVYTVDELYDIEKEMRTASEAVICVSELSEEECAYLGITVLSGLSNLMSLTKEQLTIIASLKGEFNKMNETPTLPAGTLIGLTEMANKVAEENRTISMRIATRNANTALMKQVADADLQILKREFEGTGIGAVIYLNNVGNPSIKIGVRNERDTLLDEKRIDYKVDSTNGMVLREMYVGNGDTSVLHKSLEGLLANPKVRDIIYRLYATGKIDRNR